MYYDRLSFLYVVSKTTEEPLKKRRKLNKKAEVRSTSTQSSELRGVDNMSTATQTSDVVRTHSILVCGSRAGAVYQVCTSSVPFNFNLSMDK